MEIASLVEVVREGLVVPRVHVKVGENGQFYLFLN